MSLFQILEVNDITYNNSGNKVVADIFTLAKELGFNPIQIMWKSSARNFFKRFLKKVRYYLEWNVCYKKITKNSIVLLQYPLHIANAAVLKKLKHKKNIKIISVVIDIEELRKFYYNEQHKKEFELMLEIADVLIVHNNIMVNFFLERGIPKEKLINIESFDYLQDGNNTIEFEKSLSFAGNLDKVQCSFVDKLAQIKNIKINLYGSNFDISLLKSSNVTYRGSFSVDEIPKKLNKGFGLVWNGDSIDTCSGNFGQYLKYNNPHKLSLYLSCGLPVVIWKQAAQSDFVKKYNLGICVDSLKEAERIISNMNEKDYKILQNSVNKIKSLLCSGYFTDKAIKQALMLLKIK